MSPPAVIVDHAPTTSPAKPNHETPSLAPAPKPAPITPPITPVTSPQITWAAIAAKPALALPPTPPPSSPQPPVLDHHSLTKPKKPYLSMNDLFAMFAEKNKTQCEHHTKERLLSCPPPNQYHQLLQTSQLTKDQIYHIRRLYNQPQLDTGQIRSDQSYCKNSALPYACTKTTSTFPYLPLLSRDICIQQHSASSAKADSLDPQAKTVV